VTNRSHVDVRLISFEFFLRHQLSPLASPSSG
jgi:hypothetical protein